MSELEDKDLYIKSLEERIASLVKTNASLRQQLEIYRRNATRHYRDQSDYIPYHEED